MKQASKAEQIADAVSKYEHQRTGNAPKSITVILNANILGITLHDALSPAEIALSKTKEGMGKIQEFHRQLFATSSGALRSEIERILKVDVREASSEIVAPVGSVLQTFRSGTIVEVYMLGESVPTDIWPER